MPERNEYTPGTPNWVDLQTSDQDAAKKFYGDLFGWSYNDQVMDPESGAVYSMAQLNGRDVGAIAPLPPGAAGVPPHWNSYVSVTDVDATTALAEPAGGAVIMPPMDVLDAGRMSVVADSTGAMIALWQAKNHIGAGLCNEAGTYAWNELLSSDIPKAAEFYEKVLGWKANTADMPGMTYTEFQNNGETIAGGMAPPMPMPNVWTIYFATDDTDATVEKAQKLGATVIQPPMDIPVGRLAVLADPQGAMFNVMKMNQQ